MTQPGGGGVAVGVDVGGTYVKAGLVAADGSVLARTRRATATASPADVLDGVEAVVTELVAQAGGQPVLGVGVGVAGFVDHSRGTVVFAPHLPFRDLPLRELLQTRLALPVAVDNDANAAGWAEHRFGAGRGQADMVLVTLGTGIGGAQVVGERVVRGRHGLAGEYGHMTVVPDGRPCECGRRGCWEQYASGSVLRRAGRAVLQDADSGASGDAEVPGAAALLDLAGGRPEQLLGEHVTRAALGGDDVSVGLLADVGRWLGVGLANLASALDPGCFVVGGGVVEAGDLLLGPARQTLAERLPGAGHRPVPDVRPALLGNDAGLVGAADLLRSAGRRR